MLEIEVNHWSLAEDHFSKNKQSQKFVPESKPPYCFIQTNEGHIVAMARKRFRDEYVIAESNSGIIVKVQNKDREEFACKISPPDIITYEKSYQLQGKVQGESLKKIIDDISKKKRSLLHSLEKDLIALKTTLALLKLHQERVVHGNISCQTVMVCLQEDITVFLPDVGSSLRLKVNENHVKAKLPGNAQRSQAPEVLSERKYSFASDYYSLGVLFATLNRPQWANRLMHVEPHSRINLHEILVHILTKILNENLELSQSHIDLIQEIKEKKLNDYFIPLLEQGVTLDYLIQHDLLAYLFDHQSLNLLALNLCKSYFEAFKENTQIKIYNLGNFIVQINNGVLTAVFDSLSKIPDSTILPPESKEKIYCDRSAVFSLGKILELLGIEYQPSIISDYTKRPDILTFMKELYYMAKREVEEECDINELRKIYSFLIQQETPSLILLADSDDNIDSDDNEELADKIHASRRNEDSEELIFQMDDIGDALKETSFLVQYAPIVSSSPCHRGAKLDLPSDTEKKSVDFRR